MRDQRSGPSGPSPWVERFIGGAPIGGTMLDVACGSGRHLRLGRAHGLAVTGVDRDLTRLVEVVDDAGTELIETDLESGDAAVFAGRAFGLVVVTNYLWRPILPDIVAAVAADGLLIYETFASGHERNGKPSNPDFLLQPGELLTAIAGRLTPFAYEHVSLDRPQRIVQRICAGGPRHPWNRLGAPGG